eukprot:TRINITY_DN20652_c0_g1_i3.p1 TRINITY_DN20652_c0_g1~~TRINITY_DN20652_c0_g1_i3.p1  ORF type:complete len:430 (+),score=69.43 TRINITY_DN20652_c0_g1_i3:123-1412(+)
MLHLQDDPAGEILYMSFNQDFTCFVCGTETGFRVYSTDPFRLMHRRDFEHGGGLGVVAMLFRTNILALAGGGKTPRFQPNKVILWDDQQKWVIAELNFRSPVKAVRLRRDLVVVAIESKVFVYSFRKLTLIDSIETTANPKGLCCLSPGSDRVSLVCPGMQQGSVVAIVYPPRAWSGPSAHATVERERTMIIAAHSSPLMAMCTCYNGALLATASDKGTIVRVYDATSGAKLQELRRGWDKAEIHSLTLSPAGDWLAAASEKGTVHVFSVRRNPAKGAQSLYVGLGSPRSNPSGASESSPQTSNSRSSLQSLSKVLPAYFSSEWSLAQFRVTDYRFIAAFGSDPHTVIVVCANGSYYKARFDPQRGGEMTREEFARFDEQSENARGGGGLPADGGEGTGDCEAVGGLLDDCAIDTGAAAPSGGVGSSPL